MMLIKLTGHSVPKLTFQNMDETPARAFENQTHLFLNWYETCRRYSTYLLFGNFPIQILGWTWLKYDDFLFFRPLSYHILDFNDYKWLTIFICDQDFIDKRIHVLASMGITSALVGKGFNYKLKIKSCSLQFCYSIESY